MELSFEYWYLLPAATVIATIAMSSGIGGAVFFAPLFILVLGLDPTVAVGAALATELFGFGSGLAAYLKRKLVDFKLAGALLIFAVPAAVVGTLVGPLFPSDVLKAIFAVGIIFIGTQLYLAYRKEQREKIDGEIAEEGEKAHENEITGADGKVYRYTVSEKNLGRAFAAVGGAFVGMISVGLAELTEYLLIARCRVPSPVAVATSIFLVVITVLAASVGHFYHFLSADDPAVFNQVASVVIFTIPGVVVGGQVGPMLQSRLNPDMMKVAIAFLFVVVGALMLGSIVI